MLLSEVYEVSGVFYGPLFMWTNYIKGYRYRWFMLQNGLSVLLQVAILPSHTYHAILVRSHRDFGIIV